jgi:hypothetical protein
LEKMSSDGGKRGKRRKSGKEESRGEGRDWPPWQDKGGSDWLPHRDEIMVDWRLGGFRWVMSAPKLTRMFNLTVVLSELLPKPAATKQRY